jgi:iron(III) transport system substrate-binding protein
MKMTRFAFPELTLTRRYLAAVIFTAKTGIDTNVVYSTKGSEQRLKAEGPASPAMVILTEEKAQHRYGEINFEYPVNPAVSVNGVLGSWGCFKPDSLPIQRLAASALQGADDY